MKRPSFPAVFPAHFSELEIFLIHGYVTPNSDRLQSIDAPAWLAAAQQKNVCSTCRAAPPH